MTWPGLQRRDAIQGSNARRHEDLIGVTVRRERRWTSAGATPARELVRSTGSKRNGGGGNEAVGAFDGKSR